MSEITVFLITGKQRADYNFGRKWVKGKIFATRLDFDLRYAPLTQ